MQLRGPQKQLASGVILGAVFLTLIGLCEAAPTGELAQPPETDGCVSETGLAGECTDGKALDNPASVAVSPDGKHVYITSGISNAVAVFSRKKTTGVLTQLSGADG